MTSLTPPLSPQMVVALLSNNFEKDTQLNEMLCYTMDTLKKDYIVVVVAENNDWEKTDLGMQIGKHQVCQIKQNKNH